MYRKVAKIVSNNHLGSCNDQCYIQIHVLTNNVIRMSKCIFKILQLRLRVRIPTMGICENKGADQLRSNCEADQRLCFSYMDSTVPLLSKSKISRL